VNPDGSVQLDSNNLSIPTYSQSTIAEFARVYTGWTYAPAAGQPVEGGAYITGKRTDGSRAVLAFYQATQELGIDGSVTTFTASEFGRTLTPSGTDGSDHVWGNHHFIIGSGVKGGQFYGNCPLLAPGGSNDANTRGG
jgi:Protein of unknown function (DUF1501)